MNRLQSDLVSKSHLKICVIVVNWNSGAQLHDCLESLATFGAACIRQTIVVDNASTDGSIKNIENMEGIDVIKNNVNLGFGTACNMGAATAKGDYFLFLNPDAKVYFETLPRVLDLMESASGASVGICGVQLIDSHGKISRSCARFPRASSFIAHSFGVDKVFPQLGHMMFEWNHETNREVDHVIGAFFFVRREVFESLGGFDESFFVYLEDLDFSLRARNAGWKTLYIADIRAFHFGGGASQQIKARRLFYSLCSRFKYSLKHFSVIETSFVFMAVLLVEPVLRSISSVLRFSWTQLKETWIAYGMLWRWILSRGL